MNPLIDFVNAGGERVLRLAWPWFWQSSLLITIVVLFEYAFQKKIRASVRYLLWLVVLVKLVLPPSLALPTGVAWWLRSSAPPPVVQAPAKIVVTPVAAHTALPPRFPLEPRTAPALPPAAPPPPPLTAAAWMLSVWSFVAVAFFLWLMARWRRVGRQVRQASPAAGFDGRVCLAELFDEAKRRIGVKRTVRLRVMPQSISPAVYGLFRPVVLLPQTLADRLPESQLRPVLLHELVHLRRRDVWVNCAQTLLQIIFWWHPLLWLANARIRRVREEAVDDAVMLALRGEADLYAPTLLEVAKVAFQRPRTGLALIGILESRSALAHRIDRLVNFKPPGRAGLSLVSLLGIAAFAAVAVPMGEGPARPEAPPARAADPLMGTLATDSQSHARFVTAESVVPTNDTVDVVLRKDGSYWIGTNSLSLDQVHDALSGAKKRAEANGRSLQVLIQADSEARYSALVSLVERNKELGVSSFSVRSIQKETSEAPATPRPIATGEARQQIIRKLDQIRLDRIAYDQATLSDVLRDLTERVRKVAPDSRLNFLFDPRPPEGSAEQGDMRSILVTIPELKDVRLADALDAVRTRASAAIRYSILDYAVVFSLKPPGPELHIRVFKVDPNTFYQAIESVPGGSLAALVSDAGGQWNPPVTIGNAAEGGISSVSPKTPADSSRNAMSIVTASVINFFLTVGVDLRPETGKNIFFGDRNGNLMVRATTEDLDRIEAALKALDTTPDPTGPQPNPPATPSLQFQGGGRNDAPASPTNLSVRTFKVDPNTFYLNLESAGALSSTNIAVIPRGLANGAGGGGDWRVAADAVPGAVVNFLLSVGVDLRPATGKTVFWKDREGILFVCATQADLDVIEAAIQALNAEPAQILVKTRMIEVPEKISDEVLTKRANASQGTNSVWTAILTPAQDRELVRWLEARNDSGILLDGQVTTLSGRQAQIQIVELKDIVQRSSNGSLTNNMVPLVPTMDLIPYVDADGYTIQMSIIPTVVEFLGYDDPGPFVVQARGQSNAAPTVVALRPHFRVRQLTTSAIVRDGQTVLLGSLSATNVVRVTDKVPVLGDLPVVGRFFRSEKNGTERKNILVFITPMIVDPAGNRVHPEEAASARSN